MLCQKHWRKIVSLRIGKHHIVKNIALLRKVNIAHPQNLVPSPRTPRGGGGGPNRIVNWSYLNVFYIV